MDNTSKLLFDLQLFAEGEGSTSGGNEGDAASQSGEGRSDSASETAVAEQRLRELGVPEDKIRKRAKQVASRMSVQKSTEPLKETKETEVVPALATEENIPAEEKKEAARMSWDEIMADPEYNKEMQAVVQSRLKSAKAAEEALSKLAPALEVLARKYDLDAANLDYDRLAKAIDDDGDYYEEMAIELGVPVETAKKFDRQERELAKQKAQQEKTLQEKRVYEHLQSLEAQGKEMKKVFPSFNLRQEMQNPQFVRMTSPSGGLTVEQAYYALYHDEINLAAMQAAQQQTQKKISNAILAGSKRPDEAGISGQAPSVTTFDYRTASKAQRDALKKYIRDKAARGEKVYPGQFKG